MNTFGAFAGSKGRISIALFMGIILVILLLLSPRQLRAVEITIDGLPPSIEKGDTDTFFIHVFIQGDERIPIENVVLNITGPTSVSATVDASCNVISKDSQIVAIGLVQAPPLTFGYGYGTDRQLGFGYTFFGGGQGYGYSGFGLLRCSIELDTTLMLPGSYTATVDVNTGSSEHPVFSSPAFNFEIVAVVPTAFSGVAPGAHLWNVKVLNEFGAGSTSQIIAGIEFAVAGPDGVPGTGDEADVINMSLGCCVNGDGTDPLSVAVNLAVDQGVVVVVSAGNDGSSMFTLGQPAVAQKAITVGATTKIDTMSTFSSRGPTADLRLKPDAVAPGENIIAPLAIGVSLGSPVGTHYTTLSGTSMSAPHVAGAAALVLQAHPTWPPSRVKAALMNSALDIGAELWDQGAGRIQVASAVDIDLVAEPPSVSFGALGPGSVANITISLSNVSNTEIVASLSATTTVDGVASSVATVTPSFITVGAGSSNTFSLDVSVDALTPAGWHQGQVAIAYPDSMIRVPYLFRVDQIADIDVTPASFSETVNQLDSFTRTLTVTNTGLAAPLVFNIFADATASAAVAPATPSVRVTEWVDLVGQSRNRYEPEDPADSGDFITLVAPGPLALTTIIVDPEGDDSTPGGQPVVDIIRVDAEADVDAVSMSIFFSAGTDMSQVVGILHLDTDQNPATGFSPDQQFGKPGQDIGVDFFLVVNSPCCGVIDIFDANSNFITSVAGQVVGQSVELSVPLSALGDDNGRMDVTMVLGNPAVPTDWAPDAGHGTIGPNAVTWLSVDPTSGSVDPGESMDVTVTIDPAGAPPFGTHTADLVISSNDPDESPLKVPVSLTVVLSATPTPVATATPTPAPTPTPTATVPTPTATIPTPTPFPTAAPAPSGGGGGGGGGGGPVGVPSVGEVIGAVGPELGAELLGELPDEEAADILRELPDEKAADILGELRDEEAADILGELSDEEAADILGKLPDGDAADVLGKMPDGDAAGILGELTDGDAADILGELVEDDGGLEKAGAIVDDLAQNEQGRLQAIAILEETVKEAAGIILDEVSKETRTRIVEEMDVDKLIERLPEVTPEKLFELPLELLFEKLPQVPVEHLIFEDPPVIDSSLTPPVAVQVTETLAVYRVPETGELIWAQLVGSPAPIDKIFAKFKESRTDVRLILENLIGVPSGAPSLPSGNVVAHYFEVSLEGATSQDVQQAHIAFYVEKSWIEENNIQKWSVLLYRLDNQTNTWILFPTRHIRDDKKFVYYTAPVPAFSTFAIAGSVDLPPVQFVASDLIIIPEEPVANEDTIIQVLVTNVVSVEAVYVANLWINHQIEETQTVTLAAGASGAIRFVVAKAPGKYDVRIEREIGTYQVIEGLLPTSTPTPAMVATVPPTSSLGSSSVLPTATPTLAPTPVPTSQLPNPTALPPIAARQGQPTAVPAVPTAAITVPQPTAVPTPAGLPTRKTSPDAPYGLTSEVRIYIAIGILVLGSLIFIGRRFRRPKRS